MANIMWKIIHKLLHNSSCIFWHLANLGQQYIEERLQYWYKTIRAFSLIQRSNNLNIKVIHSAKHHESLIIPPHLAMHIKLPLEHGYIFLSISQTKISFKDCNLAHFLLISSTSDSRDQIQLTLLTSPPSVPTNGPPTSKLWLANSSSIYTFSSHFNISHNPAVNVMFPWLKDPIS